MCPGGKYRGYDWFKSGAAPDKDRSTPDKTANQTNTVDLIRDAAIEFIGRKAAQEPSKPFFMYLPFQNIHGPYTTQQQFFDLYHDRSKFTEGEATMFGYITELDDAVGSIISKLKGVGSFDNTVIIFSSDK